MNTLFLKDMRYRRARVILTGLGITVLVSLILLLGGIMNGMRIQARQYVESTEADIWVSADGSGGAFIGFSMLTEEYFPTYIGEGFVAESASPLIFAQARPIIRDNTTKTIIVGSRGLGGPKLITEGRMFKKSEGYSAMNTVPLEVVVDEKMGLEIGERIIIGNETLKVVGKTESLMFVLDTPLLFMDIRTAQQALFREYPHVNMMIAKVKPNYEPEQVALTRSSQGEGVIEARTMEQTLNDIIEYYVDEPMKAVQFLRVMLWLAAGLLVGMITYVTMMDKTQEIGVLKAVGASNGYVMALLLKQVALISVIGVLLGFILSYIFAAAAPIFVAIHFVESIIVACISFVVCCGSGYLAARKAIRVDPMIAFRGEIDTGTTRQNLDLAYTDV